MVSSRRRLVTRDVLIATFVERIVPIHQQLAVRVRMGIEPLRATADVGEFFGRELTELHRMFVLTT